MANEHSQIVPNMQPTSTVADFKFWCQKVLPLVYDDSLSYYEVLNKMVIYLNQVIDNINADTANVAELEDDFLLLQTYVNNFFDDIDQLVTYTERAEAAQTAAASSAISAASSASNSATSASNSAGSASSAATSALSALDAKDAAVAAKTAAEAALASAQSAATNAASSATAAGNSATAASGSATNAAASAASALQNFQLSDAARVAAQEAATTAEEVLESIPEDYTDLVSEVNDLTPTIISLKDKIYQTNGGISSSTFTHYNSNNYRRTVPIFLKSGSKITGFLAGSNGFLMFAAYTSDTISAENYISGVVGFTADVVNYFEYTATQDCYVVVTTYYNQLENSYAFIYQDNNDGGIINTKLVSELANTSFNDNLVVDPLIRLNTSISSTGNISSKNGDIATNKLKINDYISFCVHGASWCSINFYDESDTFISRLEIINKVMTNHNYEITGTAKAPNNTKYARISATTYGDETWVSAYNGICYAHGRKEFVRINNYAFVETSAHRGWTINTPENTIISTKETKKHGFTSVENDIRFTSDGVAVLLHDESINRTARNSDGTALSETINIADITYAQALTYDFGVYAGEQYAGTKICTFDEQLAQCKKLGLSILIDIKQSQHTEDVINLVKKYGMDDYVCYSSFSSEILGTIATIVPNATLILSASTLSSDMITALNALKTSSNIVYASLDYRNLTDANVSDLKSNGILLALYTVDNYNSMLSLNPYCKKVVSTYWPAEIAIEQEAIF